MHRYWFSREKLWRPCVTVENVTMGLFQAKGPFPDPKESLARIIPSSAITVANSEVEKSICYKSRKKRVYSPRERAQMGKLACTIGTTAAAKSFSGKLGVTINESTVRGCKKAYIAKWSAKRLREEEAQDVSITLAPRPSMHYGLASWTA